jgi:hypothetical protein
MNERITALAPMRRLQRPALIVGGVGWVLALVGAFLDQPHFWQAYLLAYLFWLEIGLGCLGLLLLHQLVGGRWSRLIRPILETGALTLPLMALLFLPLLLGMHSLYPWLDADHVRQSPLLQQKSAWLNLPFFLGRSALYFGVWIGLTLLLSRRKGAQGGRGLSGVGLILYMLTATFAAYDWLMSLEPAWFSTIYGLIWISGQVVAALAFALIALGMIAGAQPALRQRTTLLADLGNFLLGFVLLWAYFAYSQFVITWSTDIPEEGIWYYHRTQGGWQTVALVLVALHFVLPFALLLLPSVKRNLRWLSAVALLLFLMRSVDLYWLIGPAFSPTGVDFHWLDLALWVALGGGWVAWVSRQWASRAALLPLDALEGEGDEEQEKFANAGQNA